jgi:hypothetical protein
MGPMGATTVSRWSNRQIGRGTAAFFHLRRLSDSLHAYLHRRSCILLPPPPSPVGQALATSDHGPRRVGGEEGLKGETDGSAIARVRARQAVVFLALFHSLLGYQYERVTAAAGVIGSDRA